MAKMRAIDAAVRILEKEGVVCAFGVPGAAINPLYSALKKRGSINHILARHVEGASHMAEGYTRAKAGNIGVCIGTSGPAGTDMITGLYSAIADSIPILCITGQAPRARLYKEDFQAVDIESIAKPVTKWAVTVREPALVPRVFSQAFHVMRSGRPGPVLIDLPLDVQLAEIEFDDETYEPLPVYKPAATRKQIEKALDMLNAAERPLIVAGGGVINADASDLLVAFAEIVNVPVVPTLMGWGAIPDDHVLMAGMVGLQTSHRYGNATMLESDFVLGIGNRWANRHTGSIETYTKGRTFVHVDIEPTQIGRVFNPDLGIASDAKAALELFVAVAKEWRKSGKLKERQAWPAACQDRKRSMLRKSHFDNVPIKPQRVYEEMSKAFGRDTCYVSVIGLSQIAGAQFLGVYRPRNWINAGQAGPLGWTLPAALGVRAADPRSRDRRALGRLRFPVPDRRTRGRRPVQVALHPRRREQFVSRVDPSGAARVRHGLSRPTVVREHQRAGTWSLWRRPCRGRRRPRLQGDPRHRSEGCPGRIHDGARIDGAIQRAGGGRVHSRTGHQYRDGHRDRQHRRVRGDPRFAAGRHAASPAAAPRGRLVPV